MPSNTLLSGLSDNDVNNVLNYFKAKKTIYKKDSIIMTNIRNTNLISYIETGDAAIIRYEYSGNRTIVSHLTNGDIFGKFYTSDNNNDLNITALTDVTIVNFDYDYIINNYRNNNLIHIIFINNLFSTLAEQINQLTEHMNLLAKRTIREKLLEYFNNLSLLSLSKTIYIPFSYTMLADYLSVDRCAMMRELKNLKDDGLLITYGKKIIIKY